MTEVKNKAMIELTKEEALMIGEALSNLINSKEYFMDEFLISINNKIDNTFIDDEDEYKRRNL